MNETKTAINQDKKQIRDAEKEEKHLLGFQRAKEELDALMSKISLK